MYHDEYATFSSCPIRYQIQFVHDWLVKELNFLKRPLVETNSNKQYYLFAHCHERSLAPSSLLSWKILYKWFGLSLHVVDVGCCGMAGMYGHKIKHRDSSRHIFDLSWQVTTDELRDSKSVFLATGFSCRSQVKRFSSCSFSHPLASLIQYVS